MIGQWTLSTLQFSQANFLSENFKEDNIMYKMDIVSKSIAEFCRFMDVTKMKLHLEFRYDNDRWVVRTKDLSKIFSETKKTSTGTR